MTVVVVRGDARRLPLPDASVDLVVTSPPFLNLRSYTDGGKHYDGQIGTGTRDEFLEELWAVTRECRRVLKPTGSMFVELGDSYTNKSLNLTPARYAVGCVDRLGLLARAEIVWSRPNGLPESVTDRVRRSHSSWVHLVEQPRYFAAVDEIREPQREPDRRGVDSGSRRRLDAGVNQGFGLAGDFVREYNPLGKLPGSVWTIPTEPLKVPEHLGVDHFAAFPSEWPRRLILGWSPPGVCVACGEGRRPVTQSGRTSLDGLRAALHPDRKVAGHHGMGSSTLGPRGVQATITGYVCACPGPTAPTRPAVVLDPFSGTGTVMHVASALGRIGVGTDLSADYCRLAASPELRDMRLRKMLGLDKPEPVVAGQLELDGWSA